MVRWKSLRPTPALVVALAALVAAMSGAAMALPGKGSVSANDIKKGAVKSKAIAKGAVKSKAIAKGAVRSRQVKGKSIRGNRLRDGAVKAKQIADATITAAQIADATVTAKQVADGTITAKQIADATITSQQVAPNGLSTANLSDVKVIGEGDGNLVRVTATSGSDVDEAALAAPEIELFTKGQITLYAKCFRGIDTDVTFAEIYVKTGANGAIFEGEQELSGGPAAADFLNANTPEAARVIETIAIIGAEAEMNEGAYNIVGVDGTHLIGQVTVAAKSGALAGGNGVYGAGDVCLFGGTVNG